LLYNATPLKREKDVNAFATGTRAMLWHTKSKPASGEFAVSSIHEIKNVWQEWERYGSDISSDCVRRRKEKGKENFPLKWTQREQKTKSKPTKDYKAKKVGAAV